MASKSIGTLKASLILDTKGFIVGFKHAGDVTRSAASRYKADVGGMRAASSDLGASINTAALISQKAFEQIGRASEIFFNSLERIDKQATLADRLDIDMSAMQRLGIASRIAGVDLEVLAKATLHMGKTVGTGGQSLDRRMLRLATAIDHIPDATKRADMATKVFGKNGLQVLELVADNGRRLRMSADAIDRFGLALSNTDAKNVTRAKDELTRLSTVMDGVIDKISSQMAPAVERMSMRTIDAIDRIGGALGRLGARWEHVGFAADVAGDAMFNTLVGPKLSLLLKLLPASGNGIRAPASKVGMPQLPDTPKAFNRIFPGAFERGSVAAGSAIAEAGGGNPVVAVLKEHGVKLDKIAEGVRKRPDAEEVRIVAGGL